MNYSIFSDDLMDQGGSTYIWGTVLNEWDFLSIGIYLLLMICTGIYSSFRPNQDTIDGYFLAGRFMWWLPVGASLYASNIGSEHFIGLAGSGAASGIYVGAFELNALILLQLLGWVFLPVFIASGVSTLPQYMNKRFGGRRIQTILSLLSLILYIFTKISVNMYSGAIFIQEAFRTRGLYASVAVLVLITAALTILGGLRAVIYTDTLSFLIMNVGSIFVAVKAFTAVGGYENLLQKYVEAIPSKLIPNSTCGIPKVDSWVMLRDPTPGESDMPWPGFLFGQTPASIWYWCADQMMVQRVMAAKSLSHAQGATIFAGISKLLPLFVMVIPGMIARVLYTDEVGCVDPIECQKFCGQDSCTNFAYPKLAFSLIPVGLRGIMLSVMLSALISDLTSIFNSSSTLFTMDIWTLIRPKAQEKEMLMVGRCFVLVLVAISIAWIPVIETSAGGQLYIYIQSIAAYLSPPIAAVYCLAVLYKRANEQGTFWGLVCGFALGSVRMFLDFTFAEPKCSEVDMRPGILKNYHYMYFAMTSFWVTLITTLIISHLTEPTPDWKIIRTTYATRYDKQKREDEISSDVELCELATQIEEIKTEDIQLTERNVINNVNAENNWGTWGGCFKKKSLQKQKEEKAAMKIHISQLSNLHQEKWEKKLLLWLLIGICTMAVVLYVYFSINPFTAQEIHDIQEEILKARNNLTGYEYEYNKEL